MRVRTQYQWMRRRSENRWGSVDFLVNVGWSVLVATMIVAITIREPLAGLDKPELTLRYANLYLALLLLAAVVTFAYRWILAFAGEFRMLRDYFEEYFPQRPSTVYAAAYIASIIIGLMALQTREILYFSVLFALYSVGDLIATHKLSKAFKEALARARTQAPSDVHRLRRRGWQAIEEYYLGRAHVPKANTLFVAAMSAVLLASCAKCSKSTCPEALRFAAYLVILVSGVASEVLMWRWRRLRDGVLGERYSL